MPQGHHASDEQFDKGIEMLKEVYRGEVPPLPRGLMDFFDIMVADTFGGVWNRDELDIGQRRLIVMGIIAAIGGPSTWKIQCKSALKRGELTPDGVREVLIMATPYVGYPRAAEFTGVTEEAINEFEAERSTDPADAGEGND